MVFIDGGHSLDAALTDYRAWAPHVLPGGISPSTMCFQTRQAADGAFYYLAAGDPVRIV